MWKVRKMSSDQKSIEAEIEEKLQILKALGLNDLCAALSLSVVECDKEIPRKLQAEMVDTSVY